MFLILSAFITHILAASELITTHTHLNRNIKRETLTILPIMLYNKETFFNIRTWDDVWLVQFHDDIDHIVLFLYSHTFTYFFYFCLFSSQRKRRNVLNIDVNPRSNARGTRKD